ncbi:MAG: hypothetical protein AABX23_01160 [Nanoarchaeota archaeon]
MKGIFLFFVFLIFTSSFVVAQIVRDESFVPVSSTQVGCLDYGCFMACTTSMLASLNDTIIGINVTNIFDELNRTIGPSWTNHNSAPRSELVMNAMLNFLVRIL